MTKSTGKIQKFSAETYSDAVDEWKRDRFRLNDSGLAFYLGDTLVLHMFNTDEPNLA